MKDEANHITVMEAGRKGGITLLERRGREYFVALGKKGQAAMRKRHPGMARKWGCLGGRPRKQKFQDFGGRR